MSNEKETKQKGAAISSAYANNSYSGSAKARASADAIREGHKELNELVAKHANCTPEQTGGFGAEIWHKSQFKSDAVQKGRTDLDVIIGPRGGPNAKGSPDLTVTQNGKSVAEAGLKYRSKATETAFDHSNAFDKGRQKIMPSDQVDRVRELANNRASSGSLKAGDYADTAKNATDKLSYENVSSKPLSKESSVKLAKYPELLSKEAFSKELTEVTKNGAYFGAAIQGGISLITNLNECANGDKDVGDAIVDVAANTVAGGIQGAAIGAGSTVVRQSLVKAGAANLARGAAPVAIAASALDAGLNIASDVVDFCNGDIDGGELLGNAVLHTGKAAVTGGSAWAGAEAGSALGAALGPAGALVGGLIGGIFGYTFGSSLFD